jgi:uncharacterized protein (TIRG00374 family)
MRRVIWTSARVAAAIALLYFALSRAGNLSALKQLFASPWMLLVLALPALGGAAIEALRLRVLFRSQNLDVPFPYGYQVAAVASFFSLCLPGGTSGDVMKLYYLSSYTKGRRVEIATVLLTDRVLAMFVLLTVVVSLAFFEHSLIAQSKVILSLVTTASALMVGLAAFALISTSKRIRATRIYVAVLKRMPFSQYLARISDALLAFRDHGDAVLKAAGFSLVGHMLLASMFAAVGSVVLPQAPAATVVTLSLLGMFGNALPITPGGLGVGESAFQGLFGIAGFAGGAALVLAWRIGMIFLCGIGCLIYIAGPQGQPREFNEPLPVAEVSQ